MKILKTLLLSAVLITALAAFAGNAMATQITPASTNVTGSSSNSKLVTSAGTISCTSSTATGNTGSTIATTVTINISLAYSGCTAFGFIGASVTPSCTSASFQLAVTATTSSAGTANVLMPTTCKVTVTVSTGCVVTISNAASTYTFGGSYTNGAPSTLTVSQSGVPYTSNGTGSGCPTAGSHSDGQLSGTYTFSPNVTVML